MGKSTRSLSRPSDRQSLGQLDPTPQRSGILAEAHKGLQRTADTPRTVRGEADVGCGGCQDEEQQQPAAAGLPPLLLLKEVRESLVLAHRLRHQVRGGVKELLRLGTLVWFARCRQESHCPWRSRRSCRQLLAGLLLGHLHQCLLRVGLRDEVLGRHHRIAALVVEVLQMPAEALEDARLQHVAVPVNGPAADEGYGLAHILAASLRDVFMMLAQAVHLRALLAAVLLQVGVARSRRAGSTGPVDCGEQVLVEGPAHALEHVQDQRVGAAERHSAEGVGTILLHHQWPREKVVEDVHRHLRPRLRGHGDLLDEDLWTSAASRKRPAATQKPRHGLVELALALGGANVRPAGASNTGRPRHAGQQVLQEFWRHPIVHRPRAHVHGLELNLHEGALAAHQRQEKEGQTPRGSRQHGPRLKLGFVQVRWDSTRRTE
mmetsp:Transcript_81505/g.253017  ORF Transcript_81505/g.253017 Transcript_81505/m.253017 type:complete len:433 (-) Transcript_81505:21-1319(-)